MAPADQREAAPVTTGSPAAQPVAPTANRGPVASAPCRRPRSGSVRPRSSDAGEVLTLQRAAFVAEAQLYGQPDIQPLRDTVDDVRQAIARRRGPTSWSPRPLTTSAAGRDGCSARPGWSSTPTGRPAVVGPHRGRAGRPGARSGRPADPGAARPSPRRPRRAAGSSCGPAAARQSNLAFYRRHGYLEQPRPAQDDRGITLQVMRRDVPTGEARADVGWEQGRPQVGATWTDASSGSRTSTA